jgi:hypothetical protein
MQVELPELRSLTVEKGSRNDSNGDGGKVKVRTLKNQGCGTLRVFTPPAESAITGTVKGSDVTIDFEASGAKIHYSGKVDKDGKKIAGDCDYGGQASGTFVATKKESK